MSYCMVFGLFKKKDKVENKPQVQITPSPVSLDHLNLQEKGEVEELLSKLYLLSSHLNELRDRYIKPLVGIRNIVEHKDTLSDLFESVKRLQSFFTLVEKESYRTILLAKEIKQKMVAEHNLKNEHEFLPEEKATFATVLEMSPLLSSINDGIFFCLQTVEEVKSIAHSQNSVIHESEVEQEITSILQKLEEIRPILDKLIPCFRHLVHLNNKYTQGNIKKDVEGDLGGEKKDLESLAYIYKYCANKLSKSRLMLWTVSSGRQDFKDMVNTALLPKLRMGLQYEQALQKAIEDIQQKTLILPQDKNMELRRDQVDVAQLSGVIRKTFAQVNTNTVPAILHMIENDQNHAQVEEAIVSMIHLFEVLEKKVTQAKLMLDRIDKIYSREEHFELTVRD